MQILFLSYLTQALLVFILCLHSTSQTAFEWKSNDIWICSFLFLFPVLFNKSSVKIVLRSFNPLFPSFVSSPYFSINSLLCPNALQLCSKIIAFMPQFHCFYCPKAVSLQSGKNGDEKGFNRREKRMGYIEAVKG